ncbi:hypothetical protein DFR29_12333 [Tahibacter aquaticus]|uniref:PA14 domain-containing protein n=1 Tax=Tahibacter aquaticus TaxID=520092 RepID=A0A4R6YL71_9GAMM|nr:hypothetical protein [Tahibacter aquaticus]TDR37859.1 hypothetical protein DFR29_12333 [Tahibacter aquaticus]
MDSRRQDWALSALLLTCGSVLACAMWPQHVAPVLRLKLERNASPVLHLDQVRQVIESREVFVDRLDLSQGGRLRHVQLGDIGYAEHFFLSLRKRFRVNADGDYRFLVGSDDGFSLRIDNRPLCADPRPRAMVPLQTCGIRLNAGEHELALDYFQGTGQSGLSLHYGRQDQGRNFGFGEDSPYFRFARESRD